MARWTGDEQIESVLAAGSAWRSRCLERDGSILSDRALWTPANIKDLHALFSSNPIEGSDTTFVEKLRAQLAAAPADIVQLAAEAVWVIQLFPHADGMAATTKRQKVIEIWSWSGESEPPDQGFLGDAALKGAGGTGTYYQTNIPGQFAWLLDVAMRWKREHAADPSLGEGEDAAWRFAEWLDRVPGADKWPLRHALLYFCFPAFFERNVSSNHRLDIFLALRGKLSAAELPAREEPVGLELDRALFAIRRHMGDLLETDEIDFYKAPLRGMWLLTEREKRRKAAAGTVESLLANYNLELHQTGSKKKRLKDTRPVDSSVGFWSNPNDATNKPLRWILHLDAKDEQLLASMPDAHGSNRIAFVNSAKGVSGGVFVRIVPAIKLAPERFEFFESWEWLLMLCFLPALEAGSAAQLLENYNPATGSISWKGRDQPYVHAALIALNEPDAVYVGEGDGPTRRITYQEATEALRALLRVEPTAGHALGEADHG